MRFVPSDWFGIAGNQSEGADVRLRALGVEGELVAGSSTCGLAKPPRVCIEACAEPADLIVSVGDRLDN